MYYLIYMRLIKIIDWIGDEIVQEKQYPAVVTSNGGFAARQEDISGASDIVEINIWLCAAATSNGGCIPTWQ
jgi:hypothetical protein